MMPLLVAMLRRRPFQGLTMLLLAAAATFAALAGPAYLRSIDAHVASSQFNASTLEERRLTLVGRVDQDPDSAAVDPRTLITTLLPVANFTSLTSVSFPVVTPVTDPRQTAFTGTMVDRQDECEHIRLIAGRCVAGVAEVMLPDTTATRLHLAPGDTARFAYSAYDNTLLAQEPAGSVLTTTVVGVYQPIDPADIYWGAKNYFAAGLSPPILTDDATVAALAPAVAEFDVDAIAAKAAFTGDLDALSKQVTAVTSVVNKLSAKMDVSTQIPDLITAIRSNQRSASEVIPVASAPLVVFAWCVIFIAASYAAASRRGEFAVIGLRGAPLRLRWLLAVGESITAIIAGTAAGYAITSLWTPVNVIWPVVALAGSIIAALLAQFRLVAGSVSSMLRHGKPGSGLGWIARAAGVLIVLVTVAAVVRLRESGGDLSGVTALAPGLVVLGTAVLASLAVVPVARVLGRTALRRGRVATALAAYYVGRRPGAQRLLILIAIAVGLLAFATAGLGVASRDRAAVARVQTGAPTVLSVDTLTRAELLEGVRAADPSGAWAMAVASRPANDSSSGDGSPPTIAVDATRLGAVATWLPAYGSLSAARIGALLHPTGLPAPTIFTGSRFELTATVSGLDPDANIFLDITLLPLDGSKPLTVSDQIRNGPVTIGSPVTCQMGCRLRGFSLDRINSVPFRFVMTLHALSVDGKPLPNLDTGHGLVDVARWSRSRIGHRRRRDVHQRPGLIDRVLAAATQRTDTAARRHHRAPRPDPAARPRQRGPAGRRRRHDRRHAASRPRRRVDGPRLRRPALIRFRGTHRPAGVARSARSPRRDRAPCRARRRRHGVGDHRLDPITLRRSGCRAGAVVPPVRGGARECAGTGHAAARRWRRPITPCGGTRRVAGSGREVGDDRPGGVERLRRPRGGGGARRVDRWRARVVGVRGVHAYLHEPTALDSGHVA